jgi:hypothetical protein
MGVVGYGNPKIGPNSAFPHGSSVERKLAERNIVLVSGGCTVEGFNCDVDRTTVFGTPTDKHRKVFDVVKKVQTEAIKAVRPGMLVRMSTPSPGKSWRMPASAPNTSTSSIGSAMVSEWMGTSTLISPKATK